MNQTKAPEQRTVNVDVSDLDTRGRTVHGYAAVYDHLSEDLGGFRERIAPGAFADVLDSDVRALLNHDSDQILGRTKAGTLRLADDDRGLRFELDLPESPIGQNVREAVGRGDLDGASFRFLVGDEDWADDVRTVQTVKELHDVTIATHPAYPDTSIELRTRPEPEPEGEVMNETETAEPTEEVTEERTAAPVLSTATLDQTSESRSIDDQLTEATLAVRPGESRALTTAIDIAPTEVSSHLFEKLRASSVALRSGINVISTDKFSVSFPKLTVDVTPGWFAEAAEITASDPTLTTLTATPKKVAARTVMSNEVIEDSEPDVIEVLRSNMLTTLALKLDVGILEGTGQSNQPKGLSVISNTLGTSTVGSIATKGLEPFLEAITALEAAGASPGAFVVAPNIWKAVRELESTGDGRYMLQPDPSQGAPATLFGVPVFVSAQIKADGGSGTNESNILCYDPAHVFLVRRTEVAVELDRGRLFDHDQSELRAKMRADLLVSNPTAVYVGKAAKP